LFLEKKWLRNHIIASDNVFDMNHTKLTQIQVKVKDRFELRDLICLSAQMRQSIVYEIWNDIKALAASRNSGNVVGKLKFVSSCNMIDLPQFNTTYYIDGNCLKIQKFKGTFKLQGLKQIPEGAEFANAKLIQKPSGYYVYVICFVNKVEHDLPNQQIGLDFGIKDNIADSEGKKHNWEFEESRRLKRASRKQNRRYVKKQKLSNRQRKIINLEYEKIANKKKDARNKFVSELKNNYNLIAIQDENIAEWKSSKMNGWGKRIHHTIMGGIISDIKQLSQTVVIDKWEPTTRLCPNCNRLNNPSLDERVYNCICGYSCDRDTHSARNILRIAKLQVVGRNLYREDVPIGAA